MPRRRSPWPGSWPHASGVMVVQREAQAHVHRRVALSVARIVHRAAATGLCEVSHRLWRAHPAFFHSRSGHQRLLQAFRVPGPTTPDFTSLVQIVAAVEGHDGLTTGQALVLATRSSRLEAVNPSPFLTPIASFQPRWTGRLGDPGAHLLAGRFPCCWSDAALTLQASAGNRGSRSTEAPAGPGPAAALLLGLQRHFHAFVALYSCNSVQQLGQRILDLLLGQRLCCLPAAGRPPNPRPDRW